jgi:hypothetical protein
MVALGRGSSGADILAVPAAAYWAPAANETIVGVSSLLFGRARTGALAGGAAGAERTVRSGLRAVQAQ